MDAVVLSHLHGDHFDRVARRELERTVPVVTTPHAAARLERWGFSTNALDTWETQQLTKGREALHLTSVPAIHARGLMGRLLPPVMGTVLEHIVDGQLQRRLYVSGDTLTGDHIDQIRDRCGAIDTALVHLGGTRVLFHTVTMDATQGVDFLERLQPARAVGIHHDDYRVFRSPIADWERAATRSTDYTGAIRVPRRGETIDL